MALLEHFSGVPEPERVSNDTLVIETVRGLEVQLASATDTEVRKAALLPWLMVLATELYVASNRPPFLRFIAMVELWKVYATMRSDDTKGVMTSTVRFTSRGMKAKIRRTKSTGAGHKIEWMAIVIDAQCDLSASGWMAAAKDLFNNPALVWDRDYLVPHPTDCLEGAVRRPADYEAMKAFCLAVQDDLRVPEWNPLTKAWAEGDDYLFLPGVSTLWSAHSPRGMMPSFAADIGLSKEDRDFLAKWQGDGSDAYARNARAAVARVQKAIMRQLRQDPDTLDEGELHERIEVHVAAKGFESGQILEQVHRLRWYTVESDVEATAETSVDPQTQVMDVPEGEPSKRARTGETEEVVADRLLAFTKSGCITLHRLGEGCHRARSPETHFGKWQAVSEPDRSEYSHRCKVCFGQLRANRKLEELAETPLTEEVLLETAEQELSSEDVDSSTQGETSAEGIGNAPTTPAEAVELDQMPLVFTSAESPIARKTDGAKR